MVVDTLITTITFQQAACSPGGVWPQWGNVTDGKSGFVSHTKLTAEATFMDLFHS